MLGAAEANKIQAVTDHEKGSATRLQKVMWSMLWPWAHFPLQIETTHHACCLLCLLLLQPLLLWLLSRTSLSRLYSCSLEESVPAQQRSKQSSMQRQLQAVRPGFSHASSPVLLAVLVHVAAVVALAVVETSFQLYVSCWKHLCLQQQRSKHLSMQWQLRRSPPEGAFHTPHHPCCFHACCLLACSCCSRGCPGCVEDFLLRALRFSLEASVPGATTVEAVKYAVATSKQSARGISSTETP